MELRPGLKLKSAVCTTEIIVVSGSGDVDLTCGGVTMLAPTEAASDQSPVEGMATGSLMGKRYVDADNTIEVLVTKPGDGSLGIGAASLDQKESRPLPSSD